MSLTIYLSGPITRKSYPEATEWRESVAKTLRENGFRVLNPLRGQEALGANPKIPSSEYSNPVLSDLAIKKRDYLDVLMADITLVNLMDATEVSVGSCMEAAIADVFNKLVVVVMPDNDPFHDHPLVRSAGVRFNDLNAAIEYVIGCGVEQ